MPRAISKRATSEAYRALCASSAIEFEKNDCTVKALAVMTGVSYREAHKAMEQVGRKRGQGARYIEKALELLGYRVTINAYKYSPLYKAIIESYPKGYNKCPNITTHHPERFAEAFLDVPPCLLFVKAHVAAFKGGKVHDWTEGRAKRVYRIAYVEKIK